ADRIEVFEPDMRRESDDRIQIESDLRKALEKNQLKVLYQPIVYLPTKELAGFEALVRWDHPKHGMLNPIAFVPVAEESDLITKLGSYVLIRAAKECAKWQQELPRAERQLFVSVNVSSRQLFKPESVQEIRHVLGRNIVPRGALRLEITETLVMENPEQAVEVLETLRGAGAELALDDFGTGYSSLAYLQRFPFDTIKIDRELVRASSSANGAAIMRSIVALTHELSKKVVAEGVEHAEEAIFLRSIGCEYAQGYHFGEPISDRDVIQLLKIVRRSEKRLQPRGFFRPKLKTKKIEAPAVSDAAEPVNPAATALAAAADSKPHALPARAIVRPRQKAPPAA
ncbi:MAG: EAL domain-containing protein, partial [Hyphomicrobium sp.]